MRKNVEESKRALDNILTYSEPHELFLPSKQSLVQMGQVMWNYLYKLSQSDDDLNELLANYMDSLQEQDPRQGFLFNEQLKMPDQQIFILGSSRWVDQGLPIIRLGHRRAAALMATSISQETYAWVRPPFRAFYIELPDGLLNLRAGLNGEELKAVGILVHVMHFDAPIEMAQGFVVPEHDLWRYAVITNTLLTQWKLNRPIHQLVGDEENMYEGFGLPLDDYDMRVDVVVARLIIGVCLMMSNPENLKVKQETVARSKNGKRALLGAPNYRVFTESNPIEVDVRRSVSAYLRGERDSPDVRLLVRGHWKMQAHGPQFSLRKHIHVEPYWRGGEEGDPIMKRVYTVIQ